MGLLDLPVELLMLIPLHLLNIEDFVNLSSSCSRQLLGKHTSPNTILRLAAASSRVFFRPDPHFLVAATARQVSDWALLSYENTEALRSAFRGGIEALLSLCLSRAGLTMPDIRRLHASRFLTINPVADLIDRCGGVQWYSTPNFWNGGVSDANTVSVEPERSLFQIVIYGELFAESMRACCSDPLGPRFDLDLRLDYIKYCIPDAVCWRGYQGFTVLNVGPYASGDAEVIKQINYGDQVGLNHILRCRTWREAWETVRLQIGPDFDEGWRQKMWCSSVQCQGLEGLQMLRPGGLEIWRERLMEMRAQLETLDGKCQPRVRLFRPQFGGASDAPNLADEVLVASAGYWGR